MVATYFVFGKRLPTTTKFTYSLPLVNEAGKITDRDARRIMRSAFCGKALANAPRIMRRREDKLKTRKRASCFP
jgi:hypothetical protein